MKPCFRSIRLASSGGIANLRSAAEFPGELRGQDFPAELAQRMERILAGGELAEAGARDEGSEGIVLRGARRSSDLESPDLESPEPGPLGSGPLGPGVFGGADSVRYELTVETEDGQTHRFAFDEQAASPEVLDLVDDLKAELRRREALEKQEENP